MSLYAATKKSNELMAYAYAHLHGLPCIGLRFFTVYGPWGRPDMALFKFTKNILEGNAIPVYNNGRMIRDFTYIDDIVESVIRIIEPIANDPGWLRSAPDRAEGNTPYRIYNIGNSKPVELMHYIRVIEDSLGKKAHLEMLPMHVADVPSTLADISALKRDFGYCPKITVEEGIPRFVKWYLDYYGNARH
jgi:UDP-glucuronate 4-epimerase